MIGLPPAVGFVSKWYMLSGAMAAQHWRSWRDRAPARC
jgi:multicomponent Na+:H+ antiporter subunit D